MEPRRKCPYCAEDISVQAVRCPYCRSDLTTAERGPWHRDFPERRIAGVAAALSRGLGVPVTVVRVVFIVLIFVHLLGPLLYGALWLLIPFSAGGESLLERALGHARDWLRRFWTGDLPGGRPS